MRTDSAATADTRGCCQVFSPWMSPQLGTLRNVQLLVVGDTHGNVAWWADIVVPVAEQTGASTIIQVGDFGFWPTPRDGQWFIDTVARSPVLVYFLDGNHEHHPDLAARVHGARAAHDIVDATVPVPLGGALHYLPRGGRLTVDGVRFAFLGGAASIDRTSRVTGVSWFPEERADDNDLARLAAGGTCDVLITHDAPAGYDIPGLAGFHDLHPEWQRELPTCWEHRERLREALESVQPEALLHGHYHRAYTLILNEPWGPVRVVGLSCDATNRAFATVDTDTATVTPVTITFDSC